MKGTGTVRRKENTPLSHLVRLVIVGWRESFRVTLATCSVRTKYRWIRRARWDGATEAAEERNAYRVDRGREMTTLTPVIKCLSFFSENPLETTVPHRNVINIHQQKVYYILERFKRTFNPTAIGIYDLLFASYSAKRSLAYLFRLEASRIQAGPKICSA